MGRSARTRDSIAGSAAVLIAIVAVVGIAHAGPATSRIPVTRSRADAGLGVVARIPVSHPFQIAYGFGSLWVSGVGHLARIDPTTNRVIADIPMPQSAFGGLLGIGSDSVWLSFFYLNVVKRIDPTTDKVVATVPLHAPLEPVEAGGFLWVPKHRANTLAKIDLATNQVVGTFPIGNRHDGYDGAQFMTVSGSDIWANVFSLFGVARFDVASETRTEVIHTFFVPLGEILAAYGSVWTAGGEGPINWVARIDMATGAITAGWELDHPWSLADAFGSVWVSTAHGRIVQLDPDTNARVSTTDLPGHLINLAFADGSLWAADFDQDTVLRLEPT
jgi:streptogramin lyase